MRLHVLLQKVLPSQYDWDTGRFVPNTIHKNSAIDCHDMITWTRTYGCVEVLGNPDQQSGFVRTVNKAKMVSQIIDHPTYSLWR